MTPKRPGDRIKTNRRDAVRLAKLLRADELTEVWVPDREHAAIRDLSRAREAAMTDLREKRQQVLSFLLHHGKVYSGRSHWSKAHRRWLCDVTFEHPAQRIVLQELLYAIDDAAARLDRLVKHLAEIVPTWSLAPMAAAFQAMRGVAFTTAVTFLAEVGELSRFATPRQLMGYLGLVPSEHSTGRRVRHGEITKTGNARARRVLIEGAWTYRYAAKVSAILHERSDGVTKAV
jgi:transposase